MSARFILPVCLIFAGTEGSRQLSRSSLRLLLSRSAPSPACKERWREKELAERRANRMRGSPLQRALKSLRKRPLCCSGSASLLPLGCGARGPCRKKPEAAPVPPTRGGWWSQSREARGACVCGGRAAGTSPGWETDGEAGQPGVLTGVWAPPGPGRQGPGPRHSGRENGF